jgi:hypothetical protein
MKIQQKMRKLFVENIKRKLSCPEKMHEDYPNEVWRKWPIVDVQVWDDDYITKQGRAGIYGWIELAESDENGPYYNRDGTRYHGMDIGTSCDCKIKYVDEGHVNIKLLVREVLKDLLKIKEEHNGKISQEAGSN